jgi:hypothetical protein
MRFNGTQGEMPRPLSIELTKLPTGGNPEVPSESSGGVLPATSDQRIVVHTGNSSCAEHGNQYGSDCSGRRVVTSAFLLLTKSAMGDDVV